MAPTGPGGGVEPRRRFRGPGFQCTVFGPAGSEDGRGAVPLLLGRPKQMAFKHAAVHRREREREKKKSVDEKNVRSGLLSSHDEKTKGTGARLNE